MYIMYVYCVIWITSRVAMRHYLLHVYNVYCVLCQYVYIFTMYIMYVYYELRILLVSFQRDHYLFESVMGGVYLMNMFICVFCMSCVNAHVSSDVHVYAVCMYIQYMHIYV